MLILAGSIIRQLGKDRQRLCQSPDSVDWGVNKQSTQEGCRWGGRGGGQSTVNLGRIHEDFAMIASDSVDPGDQLTVNLGRICKDFARITSDSVDPGGGQLTDNLGRIHEEFARITSDSVDPGGSINSQLGKDPQRLCKDYL